MKKIILSMSAFMVMGMSGCVQQPVPTSLEVITIPQPTFNILKVYADSQVVRIPATDQTVVCNGCEQDSTGFDEGESVVWIRLVPKMVEQETVIDAKHFDFDKAILKGDLTKLREIADAMLRDSTIEARIVGHTDSIGSAKYNKTLGLKRANAVKRWLVKQSIDQNRIHTTSKGESEPIASNKTAKGRAKNRRAVITINISE